MIDNSELIKIKADYYDPANPTSQVGYKPGEMLLGFDRAIVLDNKDPDGLGRLRVHFKKWHKNSKTGWIPAVRPYATAEAGMFFLPDPGDEVICGFFNGNADKPVVLGTIHKKREPAALAGDMGAALKNCCNKMKDALIDEGMNLVKNTTSGIISSGTKLVSSLAGNSIKSLNLGKVTKFVKALGDFASALLGALSGGLAALMKGAMAKAGVKEETGENASEEEKIKNKALKNAFALAQDATSSIMSMAGDILNSLGESGSDSDSTDSGKKETTGGEDTSTASDGTKTGTDNSSSAGQGQSSTGSDAKSMAADTARGMGQSALNNLKQAGTNLMNKAMGLLKGLFKGLLEMAYQALLGLILGDPRKNFTMLSSKSGMRIIMQEIDGMEQVSLLMCPAGLGVFAAFLRYLTHTGDIQIHVNKTMGIWMSNDIGEIKIKCKTFNLNAMLPPVFMLQKEMALNCGELDWKALVTMMLAKKDAELKAEKINYWTRLVLARGKLIATKLDMVVGTDIHNVEVPTNSGTRTVPLPHPYAGMLWDKLSSDVNIAFFPAATKDSKSKFLIPGHIAMAPGIKFTSQPDNEGIITSGTEPSVLINKKEAAVMLSKVTTCNDMQMQDHCQVVLGGALSLLNVIMNGGGGDDSGGGGKSGGGGQGQMQATAGRSGLTWQKIRKGLKTFTQAVQQVRQLLKEIGIDVDVYLDKLMIFNPILKILYVSGCFAPSFERCVIVYLFTRALSNVSDKGILTIKDCKGRVVLKRKITLVDPIDLSRSRRKEEVKELIMEMIRNGLWDGKDQHNIYVNPAGSPFKIILSVEDNEAILDEREVKVEVERIITSVRDTVSPSVSLAARTGSIDTTTAEARVFIRSMFGFGVLTMIPMQVEFRFTPEVRYISGSLGLAYNVSKAVYEKLEDNSTTDTIKEFVPEISVGGTFDNPFGKKIPGPVKSFNASTMTAIGADLGCAKIFFNRSPGSLDIRAAVTGQGEKNFIDLQNIRTDDIADLVRENTEGLQELLKEKLDTAITELERVLGIDIPVTSEFLMEKLKWLTEEGIKKLIELIKNAHVDWKQVQWEKIDWGKFRVQFKPDTDINYTVIDWNGILGITGLTVPVPQEEKAKKKSIDQLHWSRDGRNISRCSVGDKVEISARVTNFREGETLLIRIYEKDCTTPDDFIVKMPVQVHNGRIEKKWDVVYVEDTDDIDSGFEQNWKKYTMPEYVFTAEDKNDPDIVSRKSPLLRVREWMRVQLKDKDTGRPLVKQDYILYYTDDRNDCIEGTTDDQGCLYHKDLELGNYFIMIRKKQK